MVQHRTVGISAEKIMDVCRENGDVLHLGASEHFTGKCSPFLDKPVLCENKTGVEYEYKR